MAKWIGLIVFFLGLHLARRRERARSSLRFFFPSIRFSPGQSFVFVFVPALLLLPTYYCLPIRGLPNLNFAHIAILGIVCACLLHFEYYVSLFFRRLSRFDLFIWAFFFFAVFSEYLNEPPKQPWLSDMWLNQAMRGLLEIIFPYYLAKMFLHSDGLTIACIKSIAVCLCFNVLVCAYEWRMTDNLHVSFAEKLFQIDRLSMPSPVGFRFGWVRISGPFGHPILMAIVCAFGLILTYFSLKSRFWKKKGLLQLPVGAFVLAVLFMGLLFTLSRGPLLGFFLGVLMCGVGYAKNRYLAFTWRAGLLVMLACASFFVVNYYKTLDQRFTGDNLAPSAIYRAQLLEEYVPYIEQKPWLGWGLIYHPRAEGFPSIDNQFLFVTLTYGFVGLSIFLLFFIVQSMRLVRRGFLSGTKERGDRALAFTFLGLHLMLFLSFLTVYMGGQVIQLFFVMLGWIEGYLQLSPAKSEIILNSQKKGSLCPVIQQSPLSSSV